MKHFLLRAAAICSPFIAAALLAIPTHAVSLVVSAPTPASTFTYAMTEYAANFTSASAIDHCVLSIDSVSQGNMTITGSLSGTAKRSASISSAGDHLIRVTCYNSTAATAYHETTVTVFADTTAPTMGAYALTPATPIAGSPVTILTNYDDTDFGSGLMSCSLSVDFVESAMVLSGGVGSTAGSANVTLTVASAGSHTLITNCYDRSGNLGTHVQSVVFAGPADTTAPIVSRIVPTTAVRNASTNIVAEMTDNVGITSCTLTVNGVVAGSMSVAGIPSGSTAERAHTFTSIGDNTVLVSCRDSAANVGTKTVLINVSESPSVDTTAPVVTSVNPSTATAGSAVNVSASFSDAVGVTACNLYVGGSLIGSMDRSGTISGTATRSYAFGSAGTYTAEVRCTDAVGNTGSASRAVTVNALGTAGPYVYRIVKLVCPAGFIDVNHPCKAVYYVGSDGKRHAFPNERVFFTWYSNFDGIIELNSTALSGIALGSNVNYRPGVRMVKFMTLNKVYAVGRYGSLRWVTTEGIATSLYGSAWNTHIDDLSDAFFTDYTFGSDITPSTSFSPSAETSGVSSIDANLR